MPVILKPTSVIIADLGLQNGGPAHAFFTHQCRLHMDKYVPYSGNKPRTHLREDITETTTTITYEKPYAGYQYYGQRKDGSHKVVNYTTPGTGPYWDKRMWSAEKDDIVKEVQNFVNKRGGR